MSLSMLEPAVRTAEDVSDAELVRDQLFQHLIDMDDLCAQVRSARDIEESEDEELADLYAELLTALEQHHDLISDQLADVREFE